MDCTWSSWGSWGSCSKTCGSGTRTRSRSRNGPFNGGSECLGSSSESSSCNTNSCPGEEQYWLFKEEIEVALELGCNYQFFLAFWPDDRIFFSISLTFCYAVEWMACGVDSCNYCGVSGSVCPRTTGTTVRRDLKSCPSGWTKVGFYNWTSGFFKYFFRWCRRIWGGNGGDKQTRQKLTKKPKWPWPQPTQLLMPHFLDIPLCHSFKILCNGFSKLRRPHLYE